MYPHYCAATTGSTFDAVTNTMQKWRWVPSLRFISTYHDHPHYIKAMNMVNHIKFCLVIMVFHKNILPRVILIIFYVAKRQDW